MSDDSGDEKDVRGGGAGTTIFCIPKPFVGHFGVIQRNALASWLALSPSVRVVVFGDENGIGEAAQEAGAVWIPKVRRNEQGTPLLNDAFSRAAEVGKGRWLCYLNADIMLTDDFCRLVARLSKRSGGALVVGRRWNIDIRERVEVSPEPRWQREFRRKVRREGRLFDEWNIDWFLFPHTFATNLPPFAVGRPAWDNWMIYEARRRGIPVIDATYAVMAIHQNHDYSHTTEGREGGRQAVWFGEEAEENRRLAGGDDNLLSMEDASHLLLPVVGLVPNIFPPRTIRQIRLSARFYPEWRRVLEPFFMGERFLQRVVRRVQLALLRRGIDTFPHKEKRRQTLE